MEEVSREENSRGETKSFQGENGERNSACCFRIGPKSLLFQLTTRSARVARNNMSGRGFSGLFGRPLGLRTDPQHPPRKIPTRKNRVFLSIYLLEARIRSRFLCKIVFVYTAIIACPGIVVSWSWKLDSSSS